MGLAGAVSIILLVLVIVLSSSVASGKNDFFSTSNGLTEFKAKIAAAMKSADHDKENGFSASDEQKGDGYEANESINNSLKGNASTINSSVINSSIDDSLLLASKNDSNIALINQSAENETKSLSSAKVATNSKDYSASNGSSFFQNSTISPSGVHFNNQGSMRGVWSMEASQHGFGRNAIYDRIALSGDFDVKKSVSFKE